jgi:hypothetical protein
MHLIQGCYDALETKQFPQFNKEFTKIMALFEAQIAVSARAIEDVYQDILADKLHFILDVRNEEDFNRWQIEGHPSLKVLNIPYFDFLEDEAGSIAKLPPEQQDILVVCARVQPSL